MNILGILIIVVFLGIIIGIICIIISVEIAKNKNTKLEKNTIIKNIFINISLLIISGIIFSFIVYIIYSGRLSIFNGILAMLNIFFINIIGLIFSIIYSKKLFTTLINYSIFILCTIVTYNISRIVFDNWGIIFIVFDFIFCIPIIIGNILSYLIVKIINKKRGNFV